MKKFLLAIFALIVASVPGRAQGLSMSSDGVVRPVAEDIDARVNYPVKDYNDRLCALIKVTVVGRLEHDLTLDVGTTMQVTERREMTDLGEVWFYVPEGVRRMTFRCASYEPIEIANVPRISSGQVYRVTINAESVGTYVTSAVVKSNYLKVKLPEGTTFSLGKTRTYEITSQILADGDFSMLLNYGEYYYKAENELYKTVEGVLTVDGSNDVRTLTMQPAYSYLDIRTNPSEAYVFIDGRSVGTSPVSLPDKVKSGSVTIRVQKDMYYVKETVYEVPSDAQRHTVTVTLAPQFGTVTCVCDDKNAELFIDNQKVGVGSWTGRLSSLSSHHLEARKAGHLSTSLNFDVKEGASITQRIASPEPLYGSIEVKSEPSGANVLLDGKSVGVTPFILNEVLATDHRIELRKSGYESHSQTITAEHNQLRQYTFTLKKEVPKPEAPKPKSPGTAGQSSTAGRNTLNGHEWVDLGLPSGTKWATCNIGASSPEEYGDYFAWGETTTKSSYTESNSKTYKKSMSDIAGNPSYDAATANWGAGWKMPTKAQIEELLNERYCTWTWTTRNGKKGYVVKSKKNGNSIFLPAAGSRGGASPRW